jgi:insulysin
MVLPTIACPQFLTRHGGYNNAWTADNATCYYFSILADYLQPALDR